MHALQSNSDGLITDGLLYDAYLEEREESSHCIIKNWEMVPAVGFEPTTPCSEDKCSNPLSYAGINNRQL